MRLLCRDSGSKYFAGGAETGSVDELEKLQTKCMTGSQRR